MNSSKIMILTFLFAKDINKMTDFFEILAYPDVSKNTRIIVFNLRTVSELARSFLCQGLLKC